MLPRLNCAVEFPCSVECRNHLTASSEFFSTPRPAPYIAPTSSCDRGLPFSAPLRNQKKSFDRSFGIPSIPREYKFPASCCASTCPCSADLKPIFLLPPYPAGRTYPDRTAIRARIRHPEIVGLPPSESI